MRKFMFLIFLLSLAASIFSGCMSTAQADYEVAGMDIGTETFLVTTNFVIDEDEAVITAIDETSIFYECGVSRETTLMVSADTRYDDTYEKEQWVCSCKKSSRSYVYAGTTLQHPEGIYVLGESKEIRLPVSAVTSEGSVVLPVKVTSRNFWEKSTKDYPATASQFSLNVLEINSK